MTLRSGDEAQPTARARAKGFGRNQDKSGVGKPFRVRIASRLNLCAVCNDVIERGDLYAYKEVSQPLCASCLEPWDGGGFGPKV